LDVLDRDAEAVGHDLRERRHVTLPVRRGADEDLHGSRRQAADRGRVPAAGPVANRSEDARRREPAHLDVRREPDTELLRVTPLAPVGLLLAEGLVADELERLVKRSVEVAGIDLQPG